MKKMGEEKGKVKKAEKAQVKPRNRHSRTIYAERERSGRREKLVAVERM